MSEICERCGVTGDEAEAWNHGYLACIAHLKARLSKMGEALNLMLASPKDRLEYCKANNLFPNRKTATESVDIYWRKAIAKEALAGEING